LASLNLRLEVGSGSQADNRQFAVGFLLVVRETFCGAGDVAPRQLAGVAAQLLGADCDGLPGDLDLHIVGVRAQVVVPVGILGGPGRGRDDQPAVGAVGEVGDRGVAWGVSKLINSLLLCRFALVDDRRTRENGRFSSRTVVRSGVQRTAQTGGLAAV
jgi:hypothetical protein